MSAHKRRHSAHRFNTETAGACLHFWRGNNREADFVLERGRNLVAFEVRSGACRANVSGLEMFRQRFEGTASILIGKGDIPLPVFLSAPTGEGFAVS